jgi:hypothetical protein
MTTDTPEQAPEDPTRVNVPIDFLLEQYSREIGSLTKRAITAETQVAVLQQQVAIQRGMIESMRASRADAPETPSGS